MIDAPLGIKTPFTVGAEVILISQKDYFPSPISSQLQKHTKLDLISRQTELCSYSLIKTFPQWS